LWFIGDECAWWKSEEGAYNQDTKVLRAVRSRFATLARLKPKRILVSSPNGESGVLYEEWKARGRTRTLVVKAPTWALNPSIDRAFLDREQEKDAEGFLQEYGAEFASSQDGNAFISSDVIDRCVDRGRTQSRPVPGVEYVAWMDAAFKRDRFSFGIAHGERRGGDLVVVVDFMRHWTPDARRKIRLNDREVAAEIVAEMRPYGLDRIHGDQFADVPLKTTFEKEHGVRFIESPVTKLEHFDVFKNLRAALTARLVALTDDEVLLRDLKGLVRRETEGGHVHVSAPRRKGSYDDAANVLARLVHRLMPLGGGVDLSEVNAAAAPSREASGLDYRERRHEFGGDLMEAVY
jgi:hypothetical protein